MIEKHFQFTLSILVSCGCKMFKFKFMQITIDFQLTTHVVPSVTNCSFALLFIYFFISC